MIPPESTSSAPVADAPAPTVGEENARRSATPKRSGRPGPHAFIEPGSRGEVALVACGAPLVLTMNKAKSLAVDHLCRGLGWSRDDLRLVDALTQCRRTGWVFFYEGRDPVLVSHQGEVHVLAGDRPMSQRPVELDRATAVQTRRR